MAGPTSEAPGPDELTTAPARMLDGRMREDHSVVARYEQDEHRQLG